MSAYDKEYYKRNREAKRSKWDSWARTTKGQYTTSKNKSKLRKQEWTLTFEEYKELRNKNCHYCSGPLSESSRGLDRVDNTKGYTLENVVPCCKGCNTLKSDILSEQETLKIVQLLKELRGPQLWT